MQWWKMYKTTVIWKWKRKFNITDTIIKNDDGDLYSF